MDLFQLCRALRAAGVPDAYYEISGCAQYPYSADHYFLEEEAGEWIVGVHERGDRKVVERFADQDRACRWLLERLTDEGPSPTPATPEETDTLLHTSDEIQRRAHEDLERALAEVRRHAGRSTASPPPESRSPNQPP